MSQQLDFWGIAAPAYSPKGALPDAMTPFGTSWAPPDKTASSTLKAASLSYLVPWFEALLLASAYRADNTIASESLVQVLAMFGAVDGHSFQSWWSECGFGHLGQALTDVQVNYPTKRGACGAGVASFVVSLALPAAQAQEQMAFLVAQLSRFHTGDLSSSPLLWPSFKSALTIQRLCLYLKVVRAVIAQPEKAKNKILTVGQDMNLVPKHKVRTYDLASDRLEKHDAIVHLTYDYFQKGRALVINAARGNFPCVVMPREFVQIRRKSRKLTAAQHERWGT